jgi:hypothetical protein
MAESILLTAARVSTFDGDKLLTGASGFFFLRDERLFFVTSRHVVLTRPPSIFQTDSKSSCTPMPST